jgi:hypothetical protein
MCYFPDSSVAFIVNKECKILRSLYNDALLR